MITHSGIMNFIDQQIELFQINSSGRALFYLSTQFDASISAIGTTFLTGATLCLASSHTLSDVCNLPYVLKKNNITHLDIPPSLLAILDSDAMPSSLETIIIGGETCSETVVRRWSKKIRLISIYGPTEATVCTSMVCCTASFTHASIGRPIANVDYQVWDETLSPVAVGELYISGVGLALGYLNNAVLTQTKFITVNHTLYYRTGDLVKREDNGNYIYLGRIDRQVKIRGQLVEPEEIEAALYQHPLVSGVAVIYQASERRKQLLAVVEAKQVTSNMLFYFLKTLLPSWMMPNHIVFIDNLPKNTNGKIDYVALHAMNFDPKRVCDTPVNDSIAQQLQHLWKEALALPFLPSIHDDLFQTLGATSLDVIKLIVCSELKGFYFSTELLNHLSTIHDLSAWFQSNHPLSAEFMPADILKKECLTDSFFHPVSTSQSNHLFITGATGFLGIHILEELLLKTDHPITCLVRAKNKREAYEKIKNTAIKYKRTLNDFWERIEVIIGDISLPQLGVSYNDWHYLCETIGSIYHCAAEVNMSKSFAELKQTNVDGTKEIARLALSITKKQIYYLSTLSVFVATDQNTGICKECDTLEHTERVYGGYAQSKWAAEYFLQHASINVSIFRLGLITGHSVSGEHSDHDYLDLFVKGLQAIGSIPDGAWDSIFLDATPVDFAAQAIVYLSLHAPSSVFHIVNERGFSLSMIVHGLKRQGVALRVISGADWLTNTIPDASMAASYMALCRILSPQHHVFERFRSMDLFQATDIEFEQNNTLHYLINTPILCPQADERLLDTYLTRILHEPS